HGRINQRFLKMHMLRRGGHVPARFSRLLKIAQPGIGTPEKPRGQRFAGEDVFYHVFLCARQILHNGISSALALHSCSKTVSFRFSLCLCVFVFALN
ncbi:MAG: hypothetical protein J6E31_03215, partial [Pyramidobacter sp.]|nr:hypothetical protein [Pyramidobacter sp.]